MNVLVCTDFTAASAAGEREAAHRFPDAQLVVLHVVDTSLIDRVVQLSGHDGLALQQELTEFADLRLNEIVERLVSQGRKALADLAAGIDRVEIALAAAARHRAETIVLGAPPLDTGWRTTGRFRAAIARRSRVPVLVIPG